MQQDRNRAETWIEQFFSVSLDPDAVPEKLEQNCNQLFRILSVADRGQPLQHDLETAALCHDVGQSVDFFIILIVALLAGQVLDELLGCVAEQASHPVDDPHGFTLLGVGQPDALVHVLDGQVERDYFVVNLKLENANVNIFRFGF